MILVYLIRYLRGRDQLLGGSERYIRKVFLCGGGRHILKCFLCGRGGHIWEAPLCGGRGHVREAFLCGGGERVRRFFLCSDRRDISKMTLYLRECGGYYPPAEESKKACRGINRISHGGRRIEITMFTSLHHP